MLSKEELYDLLKGVPLLVDTWSAVLQGFFSAMSSVLTCVSVLTLFCGYSCLFSFLPLFPHASSPALSQLKPLHPRCCHPSSYQMKTSALLWTRRLFHQTVYLLIQAPSHGSSWAFPTWWWERKTNWWKLGIHGFIFIVRRGFGHVQLSILSVSYNQCCCMRARLVEDWVLRLNWWWRSSQLCSPRWSSIVLFLIFFSFQSPNEVYSFERPSDLSEMKSGDGGAYSFLRGGLRSSTPKRHNCISLLSANQVVRALPPNKVPLKEVYPKGQSSEEMWSINKISLEFKIRAIFCFLFSENTHSSCFTLRCHSSTDSGIPGGDWSKLQKSQICSCTKVNTNHARPQNTVTSWFAH